MNSRWLFAALLGAGLLAACQRDGPAEEAATAPPPVSEAAGDAAGPDLAATGGLEVLDLHAELVLGLAEARVGGVVEALVASAADVVDEADGHDVQADFWVDDGP